MFMVEASIEMSLIIIVCKHQQALTEFREEERQSANIKIHHVFIPNIYVQL